MTTPPAASGRHVAILLPSLRGGGAERITLLLASGLLARGHRVSLLLEEPVCDYPGDVAAGVRIFFLPRRGAAGEATAAIRLGAVSEPPRALRPHGLPLGLRFPRLALAAGLRRDQRGLLASTSLPRWAAATAAYLDRERPDAVLAMMVRAGAAAAMAKRLTRHRVRTVAVQHNVFKSRREVRRARASYPSLAAVAGVSSGVSAELGRFLAMPGDRIHTVHNPAIPADLDRKILEPAGHPWFDEPGPPVLLSIGRLHRQKDLPTLLAAFARLRARRRVRLAVLGTGSLLPELRSLARRLRILEHVDFPGFTANPYAFLAKASLFVLSSRHEGLPTVLIEALACGCPVVSTDCPFGPAEILEGGRWGELVPVGDPDALAAAMARGLETPARRDDLRRRAEFFGIERAVARYEALLFG